MFGLYYVQIPIYIFLYLVNLVTNANTLLR